MAKQIDGYHSVALAQASYLATPQLMVQAKPVQEDDSRPTTHNAVMSAVRRS